MWVQKSMQVWGYDAYWRFQEPVKKKLPLWRGSFLQLTVKSVGESDYCWCWWCDTLLSLICIDKGQLLFQVWPIGHPCWDVDDDGFWYLAEQEESTTDDWTNAHNQKFAAGFRALCRDSDRNKVNSRLPAPHRRLLEAAKPSPRWRNYTLYSRVK